MTKYFCAYDENAIWGIGHTPNEAERDAHHWFFQLEKERDNPPFTVRPCTKRLYDRVEMHGGNIAFQVENGIVDIEED